jgi:putative endonuclease
MLEGAMRGLDLLAKLRGRALQLPAHLAVGEAGEDAAFHFLRRKGYRIVARRWSSGNQPGDLDLIAWHDTTLCFIEVKTRTERDAKPAEAAVDANKRTILLRLARRYLRSLNSAEPPSTRFDVVSVYLVPGQPCSILHFEAAIPFTHAS